MQNDQNTPHTSQREVCFGRIEEGLSSSEWGSGPSEGCSSIQAWPCRAWFPQVRTEYPLFSSDILTHATDFGKWPIRLDFYAQPAATAFVHGHPMQRKSWSPLVDKGAELGYNAPADEAWSCQTA